MKDKYVLCFKGKNSSGKEEIYKIYESSLNNIDMYTCYKGCYSNRDLYNLLPSDIQKYLNSFSCDSTFENNFFIRRSCKDIRRGRFDLPILFKIDSDIVYSSESDIYMALLKMKINSNDNDEEKKIKTSFFNKLYEMLFLKETKLSDQIDRHIEHLEISLPRIVGISRMPCCLKDIARYVCKDYLLKRNFSILLKEYKKKIDDLNGVKTRLVNEKALEERTKKRKFSYFKAEANMLKNLRNQIIDTDDSLEHEKELKKGKEKLDDNPDYISYIAFLEEKNKKIVYDDYSDEEYDDFLDPRKPNDPRYWSIN